MAPAQRKKSMIHLGKNLFQVVYMNIAIPKWLVACDETNDELCGQYTTSRRIDSLNEEV